MHLVLLAYAWPWTMIMILEPHLDSLNSEDIPDTENEVCMSIHSKVKSRAWQTDPQTHGDRTFSRLAIKDFDKPGKRRPSSAVCSQRGIAQSFEDNDGPTKVYVRYTDITCPSGGNRGVITSIRSNKDNDPSSPRSTIDKTLQRHASNALSFRLFRHHHRTAVACIFFVKSTQTWYLHHHTAKRLETVSLDC